MKRSIFSRGWFTLLLVIFTIILFHIAQSKQKRIDAKSTIESPHVKGVLPALN